jgi:cytochrome P450
MNDFANPLPVRVIAEMLGIPSEDQGDFQIWSDALADFFGNSTATVDTAPSFPSDVNIKEMIW